MKRLLLLTCLALSACATTDYSGLSKDQIAAREADRAKWSDWGRGALDVGLKLGIGWLGANRGDTDGYKK